MVGERAPAVHAQASDSDRKMTTGLKRKIKNFFYRRGYDISSRGILRIDHLSGISSCLDVASARIVFDIGANRGQTLLQFRPFFRNAHLYCFEPDPEAFAYLERVASAVESVSVFNVALGSSDGEMTLYCNAASEGNSLLEVSHEIEEGTAPGWLRPKGRKQVPVHRLDTFCGERCIERIDLLKLDTQGYEAEVLRGAKRLLKHKAINLILAEVQFSEYYENQAYFDDVYAVLKGSGYRLVDLYQKFRAEDESLTACDALFVG
jgi:FkbM family methyltransferase